jgi:SagB-type dehydrogenase family enzyme
MIARGFGSLALAPLLAWGVLIGGVAMAGEGGTVALPDPSLDGEVGVEQALAERRSVREFASGPLPLAAVSQLLWAAQGITHPTGLRTAPSAGALYPLEVYLVAGAVSEVVPGVYHYDPQRHRLVLARAGDARAELAEAALQQEWLAQAPATVVLAADFERTARKYGERARRYVHMEVGHAAQNLYLQATALGLGTTMVGAFRDGEVARTLGLPEKARPLGLLPVGKPLRPQ